MRMVCIATLMAVAAPGYAQGPQLHGRILSKEGTISARQWRLGVHNAGPAAVDGVTIRAIRFTGSGPNAGPSCTPVVKHPTLPVSLGSVAAGASASQVVTIDFTGCSNAARFTVEVDLAGSNGATGTIKRSNEYR